MGQHLPQKLGSGSQVGGAKVGGVHGAMVGPKWVRLPGQQVSRVKGAVPCLSAVSYSACLPRPTLTG
jgi:hypothetical protein